jgi:predicted outer membrane repeat protein
VEIAMKSLLCAVLVCLAAPALADDAQVSTCDQAHLQAALTTANTHTGGTITFTCSGTITLTQDLYPYYVNNGVTMVVDGGGKIVLDGGNTYAFWQVYGDGSLTLKRLTLQHAGTNGDPAHPIQSFGQLTLDTVTVKDNHPASSVIDVEGGTATVLNSTFSGNTPDASVIYGIADVTVQNSTFSDNTIAAGSGGAIRNHGGNLNVSGSTFSNNSVGGNGQGGAISNESDGMLGVSTSTFNGNGTLDGGAIENYSSTAHVVHSTFTGNTAGYGGAIENFGGSSLYAHYDTFKSNQSSGIGGAIWSEGGTVDVNWSDFDGNKAAGLGGAIECDNDELYVENTTFSGNASNSGNTDSSNYGGAIYSTCYLVVAQSTLYDNTAQNSEGGAIYQSGSKYAGVFFSTFVMNAAAEGAAIGSGNGANPGLIDSIFAQNTHGHTCAGAFTSFGYNLADDSDCGGALGADTDKPNVDLPMGPLQGHGGPTPTIEPAADNPAIDNIPAGTACVYGKTDQRGYARPAGAGCDSGALEVGATADVIFQSGFEWE